MKKVLSVLLAAAMACGLSVASFADNTKVSSWETWNNAEESTCNHDDKGNTSVPANVLDFAGTMKVEHTDGSVDWVKSGSKYEGLKVGDDLTFYVNWAGNGAAFERKADKHWDINIKANKYVEDAYFEMDGTALTVVVEIVDELDNLDAQDVEFKMYISDDKGSRNNNQSAGVSFDLEFDNYLEKYVDFDFTNDVDYMAKWIVEKNKKGTAVFDFENAAYVTVKMIPEEEVIFNFTQAYDKAIDKAYNEYDADLSFYNWKGTKDEFTKTAELFIPADKDSFIYEIVDGELVEVDAEYVKDYEDDADEVDGWVISTKELGYYVVADEELVVAEEEVEAEVEADKQTQKPVLLTS